MSLNERINSRLKKLMRSIPLGLPRRETVSRGGVIKSYVVISPLNGVMESVLMEIQVTG